MLPFYDDLTIKEHFYSFTYDNIPIIIKNKFELISYKEIDASCIPNTHWNGKQILIIYANKTLISELESNSENIPALQNTKEAYRLAMWEAYLKKDSEKKSSEQAQQELANEKIAHQVTEQSLQNANLLNEYILSSFSWKKTVVFRKIYRLCAQVKNIIKRVYRSGI